MYLESKDCCRRYGTAPSDTDVAFFIKKTMCLNVEVDYHNFKIFGRLWSSAVNYARYFTRAWKHTRHGVETKTFAISSILDFHSFASQTTPHPSKKGKKPPKSAFDMIENSFACALQINQIQTCGTANLRPAQSPAYQRQGNDGHHCHSSKRKTCIFTRVKLLCFNSFPLSFDRPSTDTTVCTICLIKAR